MSIDEGLSPNALGRSLPSAPKLPVAGFLIRLLAFALDCILLRLFLYLLALVAREPMLALGPWSGRLAAALLFAYFWLGDGPVGRGRTVGKAVLNLRTVAAEDGRPLGWGRSALRAAILCPPRLWMFYFVAPFFTPGPWGVVAEAVALRLSEYLTLALILAQVFHTLLNPTRQGLHDTAARSLVLGLGQEETTWERIEEALGREGMTRVKMARRSGWICLVATFALLSFFYAKSFRSPEAQLTLRQFREMQSALDRYKYQLAPPSRPMRLSEAEKAAGATETSDASATQTLELAEGAAIPLYQEYPVLRLGRDTRSVEVIRGEFNEFIDWQMESTRRFESEYRRFLRERQAAEAASGEKGAKPPAELPPPYPAGSKLVFIYQEFLDLALYQQAYEVLRESRRWE